MKKYLVCIALVSIIACSDESEKTPPGNANEAPAAAEGTTKHPNGVTGGSVISTDTSAMKPDSSQKH